MIALGEPAAPSKANLAGQLSPSHPISCLMWLEPGEAGEGPWQRFCNPECVPLRIVEFGAAVGRARKIVPPGSNAWSLWEEQAYEVNISILWNHQSARRPCSRQPGRGHVWDSRHSAMSFMT